MLYEKIRTRLARCACILLTVFLCWPLSLQAAGTEKENEDPAQPTQEYQAYRQRFDAIDKLGDIPEQGFRIIDTQAFPVTLEPYGEVIFIPALDTEYNRFALFLTDGEDRVVYKTDRLETNNRNRGMLEQPNKGMAAVSFQDLNGDGYTDIVLITSCINENSSRPEKTYKVGDVLFGSRDGFYQDWRISDKINRFSMNKSIRFITSFVRDGNSTEFLYTAMTQKELLDHGFRIIEEQCYWRNFEKMGRLQVVPGTYTMADYNVFMIYLVNEQGYIVWSFQPMGEYDNLYALKGLVCKDVDGDGLKDIIVLGRYSYESEQAEAVIGTEFEIYYQRTGGFSADTEYKKLYRIGENVTTEELVLRARAYWGWSV